MLIYWKNSWYNVNVNIKDIDFECFFRVVGHSESPKHREGISFIPLLKFTAIIVKKTLFLGVQYD